MHTAGATRSSSGERRAASQGLQELCEEARRIRADGKRIQGVRETRADVDGGGDVNREVNFLTGLQQSEKQKRNKTSQHI